MPRLFYVEDREDNYVGPLHCLSSRNPERFFGDDGEYTNIMRVKLPRGLDAKDAADAIKHNAYSARRCGHEFDCCGCYFVSNVETEQVAKRELIVKTRYLRNI